MKPNTLIINVSRQEEIILCIEYNYKPEFYSFVYQGAELVLLRKYHDARLTDDNIQLEYDENFRTGPIIIDNQIDEDLPYAGYKLFLMEIVDEENAKISIEYLGNKSALNVHKKEIWNKFRDKHIAIDKDGAPQLAA